jgi:hypothetical protein
MKPINVRLVLIVLAAFIVGCVVGGTIVQSWMSHRQSSIADDEIKKDQQKLVVSEPTSAASETRSTASRSIIINDKRISDQDIETLEQTFRVQVRDGNYWYDRMNGSWGRQGGPTEGFIMAGLNLGGSLREDASKGDTGVFINGRQLHRIDVERLMQLGPVNKGRCWMDAQGNIGLEGQPAFANIWIAVAQASGSGRKKEGILSTYDKTGIAVFGY